MLRQTRALIFDSYYDDYRGVILYVRVFDGAINKGAQIKMMATDANGIALEVGALKPGMTPNKNLETGEIGYIVTNLKTTREAKVGDTVTLVANPATNSLPGYKDVSRLSMPASSRNQRVLPGAERCCREAYAE